MNWGYEARDIKTISDNVACTTRFDYSGSETLKSRI